MNVIDIIPSYCKTTENFILFSEYIFSSAMYKKFLDILVEITKMQVLKLIIIVIKFIYHKAFLRNEIYLKMFW